MAAEYRVSFIGVIGTIYQNFPAFMEFMKKYVQSRCI